MTYGKGPAPNGEIWKADTLYAYRAILQWMGGDQWTLLSEPEKGKWGHRVMVPITDPATGKDILGGPAMRERLETGKWKPIGGLELILIPKVPIAVADAPL